MASSKTVCNDILYKRRIKTFNTAIELHWAYTNGITVYKGIDYKDVTPYRIKNDSNLWKNIYIKTKIKKITFKKR